MERVLSEYRDEDDDGGLSAITNKTPNNSFGIAFNTLIKQDILTADTEDER